MTSESALDASYTERRKASCHRRLRHPSLEGYSPEAVFPKVTGKAALTNAVALRLGPTYTERLGMANETETKESYAGEP